MTDFLTRSGWADASKTPLTPDWSPRHTTRLKRNDGASAILVHAPTDVPGHLLDDFVRIGEDLRALDLSVPEIFAYDPERKMMLTEDFGDLSIDNAEIEREAYETAVDLLARLREGDTSKLTRYKNGYIYKKLSLFSSDPAWLTTWEKIENSLPPCPHVFSHMDYKAGNLHWLENRQGIARVGLLDYQAAQNAPFTYDIVNLLEDARRNLDPALKASLKMRFQDVLPGDWKPLFDDWYAVIAAQFHARVLGQARGNPRVAPDVVPRLESYLKAEMDHPALKPLKICYFS